jgi:hypothetical protein
MDAGLRDMAHRVPGRLLGDRRPRRAEAALGRAPLLMDDKTPPAMNCKANPSERCPDER